MPMQIDKQAVRYKCQTQMENKEFFIECLLFTFPVFSSTKLKVASCTEMANLFPFAGHIHTSLDGPSVHTFSQIAS